MDFTMWLAASVVGIAVGALKAAGVTLGRSLGRSPRYARMETELVETRKAPKGSLP